ncbi:MAG TPA: urease accessory UreF family protein [Trebonia sp.]|nr:urease accessory UreF family protein [Trebonia sp.]
MSVAGLLLGDSRFPAGGHAHSGGVEPAVTAGTVRDLDSLELFLLGRLRTAGLVAAAMAAAACAGALRQGRGASDSLESAPAAASAVTGIGKPAEPAASVLDHGWWAELDAEADARTPAPAQREASRRQGRALLRAARVAWPEAGWLAELAASAAAGRAGAGAGAFDSAGTTGGAGGAGGVSRGIGADWGRDAGQGRGEYRGGPHHAVVLGAAAAAAGCTPSEASRIAAYQAVSGPVSAAVRLLALDPMRATGAVARLAGEIERVAALGAGYADTPPAELPCPSAPALDLLAQTHIGAEVRLFES